MRYYYKQLRTIMGEKTNAMEQHISYAKDV